MSAITIRAIVGAARKHAACRQDAVSAQRSAVLLVGAGSGVVLIAKTLQAGNNASVKANLVTISTTVKCKLKQQEILLKCRTISWWGTYKKKYLGMEII